MESLGGVLEGVPFGDSVILLGDLNTNLGNDTEIWRGWNAGPALYHLERILRVNESFPIQSICVGSMGIQPIDL